MDLKGHEMRRTAYAVAEAWASPGPQPEYHYAAMARLEVEWPALAHAVRDLARAVVDEQRREGTTWANP